MDNSNILIGGEQNEDYDSKEELMIWYNCEDIDKINELWLKGKQF